MQVPDFNQVDEKVHAFMVEMANHEYEDPLVAIPIDYKVEEKDNYQKGFLMISQGAHYIFRKNILTGLQNIRIFNLLEVSSIRYSIETNEMFFHFDEDRSVYLRSDDISQVAYATAYVMQVAIYGITDIQTYEVVGDELPKIQFTERPSSLFKWRIVFLAHFYQLKSAQIMQMDYFNKWEEKLPLSPLLIVGPSLHPGIFSLAFGHAVAWETQLKTVIFQNFCPSKFSEFFQAFVANCITIDRVAFTDYQKPQKCPVFPDAVIQESSIRKYQFLRVLPQLILSFFEKVTAIQQIESLILHEIKMSRDEFGKLADFAVMNETMKNTTKRFEMSRVEIPSIHLADLTKMVNSFSNLQTISIRHMECDGMRVLCAIICSDSPIIVIHVNCMNFRRPFKDDKVIKYPKTLLHLDVSFSAFTDEAYVSILSSVTGYEMDKPIIFESVSISVSQPSLFQSIGYMDFDGCYPNISEFDYSMNEFVDESTRFLFAFIFTQKRLRLLSLNRVKAQNPFDLLKNVMLLVTAISLPGLHISDCDCFDGDTFTQFLSALCVQNPNYFRSLAFVNCKAGSNGLVALNELVKKCPNLIELDADGFLPDEREPLLELWRTMANHKTLITADYPKEDFKKLGIIVSNLPEEDQEVFKRIEKKGDSSTAGKRDEFNLLQISKKERLTTNSEIFRKCAYFIYYENENDYVTKEMRLLKPSCESEIIGLFNVLNK